MSRLNCESRPSHVHRPAHWLLGSLSGIFAVTVPPQPSPTHARFTPFWKTKMSLMHTAKTSEDSFAGVEGLMTRILRRKQ